MANIQQQLTDLDFSSHDAKVYTALLKHSPTTAGPLVKTTGLHRNIVYTSLDHLIARKLVAEKKVKNRKVFEITDPHVLIQEFETKKQQAEELSHTIAALLPENNREITIHQGNEEYLRLLTTIIKSLPKKSTKYVLGTGGKTFMEQTMLPIWQKYHASAFQQQLNIKMIGYESQRSALSFDDQTKKIYTIKFLPDNIENPAGLHIYPDIGVVLNIIYSDNKHPVTAIKIQNQALCGSYLALFNNLWKMAKN